MLNRIKGFGSEVRAEMQKVTWSSREELIASTMVVLTTMFILSAFIGFSDLIMSFLMRLVLR